MSDFRSSSWFAALILALGIVASTAIGGAFFYRSKTLSNTISVTGSAERTVTSDTIKWPFGFMRTVDFNGVKQGNDQMTADLKAVIDLLHARGIQDSQITIQPPTLTPTCEGQQSYNYDKLGGQNCGSSKTVGYTLQQMLQVESPEVEKVTKLSQEAAGILSSNGVVFNSGNLEYYYSKLADLKLEMLAEATQNAHARAQKIVENTNGRLGNIQSAGMGVFQITPVNSTQVSDYGEYDTTSIQKKVTAIVRANFQLE